MSPMSPMCLLTYSLIQTSQTFIDPLSKISINHFSVHINRFIINVTNVPINLLSNTNITNIY